MDQYAELFRISKILLSEEDDGHTAERLLRRVVEHTGAERGFIVVREQGSYQQKFEIRYDRAGLSRAERRFSRTLVREAIETGEPIYITDLLDDQRFAGAESALAIGRCSVLAAPLTCAGEVYGVVYLENRQRPDAFSPESRAFVAELAEVAGIFIRRALDRQALEERRRSLESDLLSQHDFGGIIARHPRMLEVLKLVAQVADSDASILVRGETGTGKELIARALHVNSSRRDRPLVMLHCAALPATLLEAELFGHLAGAYTDARRDRRGRLAAAHGGTLLLDEVAELPVEVQAKLLRFLQFGEIQRVGSDQVERVNVRIVAATHRDLRQLSREGRFREDLYFRLKVIEVELPPLRQRPSDIPLLLEHFLRRHWRRPGEQPQWTTSAAAALRSYDYPGNVRELEHAVERACLLATGATLDVDRLPPE
ncbi:MAG: GAF domain-containing protein, partial [bacterium]|nr:GAF domain-containing protein [bacterium]